ncbi:hypothetical protein LY41_001822 [Prauserella halophila]|nr:hypothetical protein [Prauserella halophila]
MLGAQTFLTVSDVVEFRFDVVSRTPPPSFPASRSGDEGRL